MKKDHGARRDSQPRCKHTYHLTFTYRLSGFIEMRLLEANFRCQVKIPNASEAKIYVPSCSLLTITRCEKDKLNVNSLIPGQTANLWQDMTFLAITLSPLPVKLFLTRSNDNIHVHTLRKWPFFSSFENTHISSDTMHIPSNTTKKFPITSDWCNQYCLIS